MAGNIVAAIITFTAGALWVFFWQRPHGLYRRYPEIPFLVAMIEFTVCGWNVWAMVR